MGIVQEKYGIFIRSLGTATAAMNSEIKKSIVAKDAVDTGFMKNTSFVKITLDDDMRPIDVDINSTEYYKYVDEGTRHITPREISKHFSQSEVFTREIQRVYLAWYDWIIHKELV